jgi:hypothetical protein
MYSRVIMFKCSLEGNIRGLHTIRHFDLGPVGNVFNITPDKTQIESLAQYQQRCIREIQEKMRDNYTRFVIAPSIVRGNKEQINKIMNKLYKIADNKDPKLELEDYTRITRGHIAAYTKDRAFSHQPKHDLYKTEELRPLEGILTSDIEKAIIENEDCIVMTINNAFLPIYDAAIMPYHLLPTDTSRHDNCAIVIQSRERVDVINQSG